MATLDNKSVKAGLTSVMKYNDNPDKNRPADGLYVAAAYIRGSHSAERLYSRGHNGCSSNPELAVAQFRASEALYRQKKGGAREAGLAAGKQPTIAEHFFLSFPADENVSYETQCAITDRLCESDILKDFYAISNRHFNTDNDHSHILVSNYNKTGTRKLSINNAKRNALRKELDRICVDYGLSIIDDPALRIGDPDREQFVRDCVGKVKVYAPADYKRLYNPKREFDRWMLDRIKSGAVTVAEGVSKNRECTQAEAYERWIAEHPEFRREKDKKAAKNPKAVLISKTDKRAARVYYWDPRYKRKDHYYAVRRYDDDGNRKPAIVLLLELLFLVCSNERELYEDKYYGIEYAKADRELQSAYDAMRYCEEHDVRTPSELEHRIAEVGNSLSEARKGYTYYKNALAKGEDLYRAIVAFQSKDAPPEVRKEAYHILAAHKCVTPAQVADFMQRRRFAQKKVKDLDKQIEELKKDYKELKHIEKHAAEQRAAIETYVWNNAGTHSLDDMIKRAEGMRSSEDDKNISENLQKIT